MPTSDFKRRLRIWIDCCIQAYRSESPTQGKGQLTYTTAWEPVLRTTTSSSAVEFLAQKRDEVANHFNSSEIWRHGYWRKADVRQGTEHFRLFLAFLYRVNPYDETTRAQLLDAAEHVGNWAHDAMPWYESANGLYRSLILGTDVVDDQSTGWNVPDHLPLSRLALVAYHADGGDRYLDMARRYSLHWANAVNADDHIPAGLSFSGPFYDLCGRKEDIYRHAIDVAGPVSGDQDCAENLLANGAVDLFLELWQLSSNNVLRRAAEKILDELLPQLADPDAGALAQAIRYYRKLTEDPRYDDVVIAATSALNPYEIGAIGVQPNVMRLTRMSGVGKRLDMPVWFEDMHLRRHNPILLSLAAEISGDLKLATIAMDLARTYFELAKETMRTGRQNGDAANTVSAIARGHGRENGSGMVTAVFGPLQEATYYAEALKYR